MPKCILITGISGFLGSHIAEEFLNKGYTIVGLKRSTSDLWRCVDFLSRVLWVDSDSPNWKQRILDLHPNLFIHSAWNGVSASGRNQLKEQLKNLDFLADLLELAGELKVEQFIGLGSQAEYGYLEEAVGEEKSLLPDNAYGMVKILACTLLENYCKIHQLHWNWLRLFSFYGEKESENWLIPSITNKILLGEKDFSFSACTQEYAYLYVKDLAVAIRNLVEKNAVSGIYNISATQAISLRSLIEKLVAITGRKDQVYLNFGALAMRENQSKVIRGKMDKFNNTVEEIQETSLEVGLQAVVYYYQHHRLKK